MTNVVRPDYNHTTLTFILHRILFYFIFLLFLNCKCSAYLICNFTYYDAFKQNCSTWRFNTGLTKTLNFRAGLSISSTNDRQQKNTCLKTVISDISHSRQNYMNAQCVVLLFTLVSHSTVKPFTKYIFTKNIQWTTNFCPVKNKSTLNKT